MTESIHTLDITPEELFTLPCSPVLSSDRAGWNHIQLVLQHQPPYRIPEHCTPYHVICINAGIPVTLQQTVDGQSETLDSVPDEIGIYPANLWQSFYWNQEAAFLQLLLEPTVFNQLGAELYGKDHIELIPQLTALFDPLIYQIAIALQKTLETDGIGSQLYADSMATALATHLLCQYSTHHPRVQQYAGRLSHHQLRQVLDYIDQYLEQDVSLAELAAIAQLSPYHFARLFKQSTGIAPHQYHIRCRIERAKQLLLARELSFAEIAQRVGFASQGHLNYHFKRIVGVTPKMFLQQ
jgi:AraC family transcriptional regulator